MNQILYLIKHDYNTRNQPVTTTAHAPHHMAGKSLSCKNGCYQACPCLQMADEQPIRPKAFKFGARIFTYHQFTEGLIRSVSASHRFVREYFDFVLKTDRCAQYIDDIGIVVHAAEKLLQNIELVFQLIELAGTKLFIIICPFGQI